MKEIFELIESYGITLVLLVGSFYALYQFFFFSIREVKKHSRNIMKKTQITCKK